MFSKSRNLDPLAAGGKYFFLSSRVYLVFLVLHHLGEAIGHPKIQLALITDSDFESTPHGSRNVASET